MARAGDEFGGDVHVGDRESGDRGIGAEDPHVQVLRYAQDDRLSLPPRTHFRFAVRSSRSVNVGSLSPHQIAAKRKELDTLLAPGTSKGDLVKKLFEQIGSLKGEQLFTGYQTAIKMKAALTDLQRAKLAAMKPQEFHQAMTSGMSINDRMEMRQFMGEDVISQDMVGTPGPKQ